MTTSPSTVWSNGSAQLTSSSRRRVVHRWTPSSVQSWKPATPSAHPSHTPFDRIDHALRALPLTFQATLTISL